MKRKAIITFDYEVFLGQDTGTIENCVLKPTELILRTLEENKATALFFIDTTWLLFLKEKNSEDYNKVKDQLRQIVRSGSSVGLHLHPQWIDAEISGDKISFSSIEHYKLHSLSPEEILKLFKKSKALLENIIEEPITSFRAGGWCIEPFHQLADAFKSCNIKYDFSVIPGCYIKEGKEYDIDFTDAPTNLIYYNFQDSAIKSVEDGSFIEVPLTTYKDNPFNKIINKTILKVIGDKKFGDGKGAKPRSINTTLKNILSFSYSKLSMDGCSAFLFKYLVKFVLKKSDFIVVVSHPKTLSNQSLKNLSYLVRNFETLNSKDLETLIN